MTIRNKKRITAALGFLALLAMLCVVRGMDMGIMPVWRGAALAAFCELTGAVLLYKSGVFWYGR